MQLIFCCCICGLVVQAHDNKSKGKRGQQRKRHVWEEKDVKEDAGGENRHKELRGGAKLKVIERNSSLQEDGKKRRWLIEEQFVPIWFAHVLSDTMSISSEAFVGLEEVGEALVIFSSAL